MKYHIGNKSHILKYAMKALNFIFRESNKQGKIAADN